jgi:acid phosphatase type 7
MLSLPPRFGLVLLAGFVIASTYCGGSPTSPSTSSHVSTLATANGTAGENPTSGSTPVEPPPPGTGSAWLNAVGDIGWCGSEATPRVARLLDTLPGDILLTGDIAYMNGSADDFRRCFDPDFGRFGNRLRPNPGNHDYATPNADGYFTYFGPRAGTDRRGFYAFRAATWKVLMLNSSVPVARNSEQYLWVERQLREEPTRCTLVSLHHPFDSSGTNGPNPWLHDLWALLHQQGVELVVAAHDHLYERFAPTDADGRADQVRGVRQITAGTGGAPLYPRSRAAANSETLVQSHGVLRLRLEPALYEWEFVDVNGASLDRGLTICH